MLSLIYLKRKILALLIFTIFLLSNSTCISDENEFPTEKQCTDYITWMLENYNKMIKYFEKDQDGFNDYKHLFNLYGDVGENFRVICLKTNQNSNKSLSLLFEKIAGNEPLIEVNFSYSLSEYFPLIEFGDLNFRTINNVLNTVSIGIIDADYGVFIYSSEIKNNIEENAYKLAQFLYRSDRKEVENFKINEILKPFENNYFNILINDIEMNETYNKIIYNMTLNINYTYNDFLPVFNELNQSLQQKYFSQENNTNEKHENIWIQPIIFFIINFFIFIFLLFLFSNGLKKENYEFFSIAIGLILSVVWAVFLYTSISQILLALFPLLALPLAYFVYHLYKRNKKKKLIKEQNKNKKNNKQRKKKKK